MSYQAMGQLIDKWMTDAEFRKNLRQNPDGALKQSGVSLTAEEQQALRKIDWSQSDENLKSRLNKM